jgi:hypothetical protein
VNVARKKKVKLSLKPVKFGIARNTTRSVTFKLSRSQYRTLRRARRMSGRVTMKSKDSVGQSKTTTGSVTLKP